MIVKNSVDKKKVLWIALEATIVFVFVFSSFTTTSVAVSSAGTSFTFFHVLNYNHWEVKVCNSSHCTSKFTNSEGNTGYFTEPGDTSATATLYHNGFKCSEVGVFFWPGKVEFVWLKSTISKAKQCS